MGLQISNTSSFTAKSLTFSLILYFYFRFFPWAFSYGCPSQPRHTALPFPRFYVCLFRSHPVSISLTLSLSLHPSSFLHSIHSLLTQTTHFTYSICRYSHFSSSHCTVHITLFYLSLYLMHTPSAAAHLLISFLIPIPYIYHLFTSHSISTYFLLPLSLSPSIYAYCLFFHLATFLSLHHILSHSSFSCLLHIIIPYLS